MLLKVKKIGSEHNPIFCDFNITYDKVKNKVKRREIFNLKNSECQAKFFEATNFGDQFKKCFYGINNLESKCNKFFKTLDDMLHKCFSKVRIRSGKRKNEVTSLIERKTNLSLSLPSISCKLMQEIISHEIQKI